MNEMKAKTWMFSVVVLILAVDSGRSQDLASLSLRWERFALSNGPQVVLQPDSGQQEISIEFWIRAGSRDEAPGRHGLAHLFEHATPYGLRADPEAMAFLKSQMTDSNAQTRKDYTRYYIRVKPAGLDAGLRYAADRLKAQSSSITDEAVERHRANVLAEIERNTRDPFWSTRATAAREAGTFGKEHPYGHGAYGTRDENRAFTARDVRQWYDRHVFAGNAVLFVVGDFDAKEVTRMIERYFADIRAGDEAPAFVSPPAHHSPANATVGTPGGNHVLTLTWAIDAWDAADDAALGLLAGVLDQRLAEPGAIAASVVDAESTYLLRMYALAGQFGVYAEFSDLADSAAVQASLEAHVGGLTASGVSEAELRAAWQREVAATKETLAALGFIGSRTELLGEGLLFRGDPDYYVTRLKTQSEMTPDEIRTTAKRRLDGRGFRLLAVSTGGEHD